MRYGKRCVPLLLLTALMLALSMGGRDQRALASRVIRLHVLANSDTPEDQSLKERVRDRVLERADALLEDVSSRSEAQAVLAEHLEALAAAGQETVLGEGYWYPVQVEMGESWFPTRQYQDFALPAGRYLALRVKIGRAEGRNWWCVVYPPMCRTGIEEVEPASLPLTGDQIALIQETEPEYVIRFRCMEWWGVLEQALRE